MCHQYKENHKDFLSPIKYFSQCLWIVEQNSLDFKSSFKSSRGTSERSVILVVDMGNEVGAGPC